ncbi:ImcF-related family protein, partial [Pseudomonas aeruginosa]
PKPSAQLGASPARFCTALSCGSTARTSRWAEGYGLYQGDMLGEESASVYRKLLIAVFAPRLVTRIAEQLRSGGSSDFLYEGLKAYLML